MRILIAEDDLPSRTLLTMVLKKQGHTVQATVNGAEAWEAMQQAEAPRLVILDWMMPEMDGLELVRRVRSLQTKHLPYLIMLTCKTDKSDIVIGLNAGANDYLTKPFNAGELCARVEVGRRMVEMQDELAAKVKELQYALNDIKILRGIIPICANCKKIRDDKGYWNQVEVYIREHSEAEFTHSLCPECVHELYPDYEEQDDE
jgi:DNA-binding response OmpR family regulator